MINMGYSIKIHTSAEKDLRRLDADNFARISRTIDRLKLDPRPNGVRKLKGSTDKYRIRVGDLRLIYKITDLALVVFVIRVGY